MNGSSGRRIPVLAASPARPRGPLPRISRNKTVSAWSSLVCAVHSAALCSAATPLRNDNLASLRAKTVALETHQRQTGSEACRAERHRIEECEALRQGDNPVGWHSNVAGISSVVRNPQVIAGNEHRIAVMES